MGSQPITSYHAHTYTPMAWRTKEPQTEGECEAVLGIADATWIKAAADFDDIWNDIKQHFLHTHAAWIHPLSQI